MNLLFCKLIFAVLLLLMEAYGTAGISNRSATLHPQDVGVVNALLKCLRRPEWEKQIFKADSCNVTYTKEVTCDCSFENNKTCQVTKIDFSNHGLKGRIPTEIGKLTSLQYLDLSSNNLRGTIPESFGNLSQLVLLVLSTNQLRGSIPESFGNLSQLVFLDLYGNYLDGPIPPSLGNLKKLKEMHLSNNWFDGSIPETLGDLPSLVYLILYNNQLSGPLRPRLGHLKNLQYLILYDNELSGELPHSFMELKNLSVFHIGGNNFTGRVPEFIGNWKNLQTFSITGNNFIGRVPEFIANLIHLESMSLVGNSFEGPLPTNISSLTNLRYLAISDLSSEGSRADRESLFPNIEGMTSLRRLILRNCLLIGPLPGSLGQIQSLNHLDLSFNRLIGEIPHFVIIPRYIFLRRNTLNGTLPQWMTELNDSSRYRDVSENNLMNAIPPVYASQKNLNLFSCCSNTTNMIEKWQKHGDTCNDALNDQLYINCGGEAKNISRTTYEADLENTGGSTFFLSENKNWGYSSMGTYIQEGTDRFIVNETSNITMVDAPLYTTARIAPISLKYYGFCLKNGNYTVKLHFAEIAWDAKKDSSNKWKRIFDVEIQNKKVFRNFNIEKEARGVHKDVVPEFNITVTDNRLEIHLYWAGKGSLYGPDYSHGPLISAISVSPQALELASKKHGLSAMKIGGIVGSALLLALLILLLFWKMGWLGGKDPHGEELKGIELLPGRFFNYRQIKAATQNFSTVNKLGEGGFGSVYKGALPDGTAIAVKQLSAKSKQGIREFVNEIGTISALRHPNLVRLMGCCAEDNQLLLVYEYMENNSLHHALFGSDELKLRLNWPTRVKICLGIAKGLAFLHEESKLRIVHRDIKPTNILLDKDLNAKISDFGFAKLYEEEKTHVITRIAGTTGYMAPEYAMRGHLTNKADVYSFGVVTLEIFSGKNSTSYRPNDQSVYLLDLAYVLQEKGNLIALVDPALGSNYAWKEAVIILDLAMLCTNPSPTLRPTMSEVVKILEGKSKIKTTSTSAPYSVDDFAMAKTIAGLSQSTPSGSTSQEGASDIALYNAVGKEIEEPSISTDNSIETITEQGGRIGKEMP